MAVVTSKLMKKPTVTRTSNRLPFQELDPRRFEDLIHALLYKSNRWRKLEHHGRLGNDGGKDIEAIESTADGSERRWVVQCKRYQSITSSECKGAVDSILAANSGHIDVLLLAVGCDVRESTRKAFEAHAIKSGIDEAIVWDATFLETVLRSTRRELLKDFFGINFIEAGRSREALIKHRIRIGDKLRKAFAASPRQKGVGGSKARDRYLAGSNTIIRNIEDDTYPENENVDRGQISAWFKVHFYDFFHNGIEVILRPCGGLINREGRWKNTDGRKPKEGCGFAQVTLYPVGIISFDNIVDFKMDSDEYGYGPHIFCRFCNGREPYERIDFRLHDRASDDLLLTSSLDPQKELTEDELDRVSDPAF